MLIADALTCQGNLNVLSVFYNRPVQWIDILAQRYYNLFGLTLEHPVRYPKTISTRLLQVQFSGNLQGTYQRNRVPVELDLVYLVGYTE
jgi:hypothetical protein